MPKVLESLVSGVLEWWSIGVPKLNRFEFRVPARDELGRVGYGLKYCKLNAAVHDSQLGTRNTQRKNEPNTPVLQCSEINWNWKLPPWITFFWVHDPKKIIDITICVQYV